MYLKIQVHPLVFLLLRARKPHRALSAAAGHEREVGEAQPTTPTPSARQVASTTRACRSAFMFAPWTQSRSKKTVTNGPQKLSQRRAVLPCSCLPNFSKTTVFIPPLLRAGTGGAAYTEQVNVRVVDHVGRSPTFFFVNYLGHTFDSWVRTNATEALASVGARTTQAEGSFGGVNSPARMHASAREEERREVRCVQRSFLFFLFSGDRTLPCHVDRASSSRLGTYLATNLMFRC